MAVRRDAAGNLIGRLEGTEPSAAALVIGSHLDTVRNAGRFDGALGVIAGINVVEELARRGFRPQHAIEVVAFVNEEGVRFGSSLTGSRAFAGVLTASELDSADQEGVTLREAMRLTGLDPERLSSAARQAGQVLGYLELHIEQGPVLESEGLAVGVVEGISGASRLSVILQGKPGHAGTVPMIQRQDALAGAAECILLVERICSRESRLVGTVGWVDARPGAGNTIPGEVSFSIDLRAPDDATRHVALKEIIRQLEEVADRRRLEVRVKCVHDAPAVPCDPSISRLIATAIVDAGYRIVTLPSGAGHDAMAVSAIAPIGMIFVRCQDGLSHNPGEFVSLDDIGAALNVLLRVVERFASHECTPQAIM